MRPKFTFVNANNELCLGKCPSLQDLNNIVKSELIMTSLAGYCGLNVPKHELLKINQKMSIAVFNRFDRDKNQRLAYLSAAGLLNINPRETHCFTTIGDHIRKYGDINDLYALYQQIGFSILINNVDNHLQNFGFLYKSNNWRLSPAFDLNTFDFKEACFKTWLTEDTGPNYSLQDWVDCSELFDININQVEDIINQFKSGMNHFYSIVDKYEESHSGWNHWYKKRVDLLNSISIFKLNSLEP